MTGQHRSRDIARGTDAGDSEEKPDRQVEIPAPPERPRRSRVPRR